MGKYPTRIFAGASHGCSKGLWAFLVGHLGVAVTSSEDAGTHHLDTWTSQASEANQEEGNMLVNQSRGYNKDSERKTAFKHSLIIYGSSSMQGLQLQLRQKRTDVLPAHYPEISLW